MKVEKTLQTEDVTTQAEALSDLPVNDEQAAETKGGPINFQKIEFKYVPYDDQHKA